MFFTPWISFLNRLSHRPRRHARRRKQHPAAAAQIERLEDRTMLSTITPGSLDPSFGDGDGIVTTDFLASTQDLAADVAIAQQPDGKIVVAGTARGDQQDFAVARYNSDGSLDVDFGDGGQVTTNIGFFDRASALAIQSDGRIVVAGERTEGFSSDFALVRYNPDGTLDPAFGGDGIVTTEFGARDSDARSVAIDGDGRIIAAGTVGNFFKDFALARYNADGSLDTNFHGDGRVTTDFGLSFDVGTSVAIDENGQVVVAGSAGRDFAMARYRSDGGLDTTFGGGDGRVTTDFFGTARARDVAIDESNRIVLAGGSSGDLALARYDANGDLDGSFDDDGVLTSDFGTARSMSLDGQQIVVAGGGFDDFELARFNNDGSPDTSFDGDGRVTTDLGSTAERANGLAIQSDGKIVAAGFTTQSGNGADFALVRYTDAGALDTTFDEDGKVTTDFLGPAPNSAADLTMTQQADGKIIAVGRSAFDFALARYNVDGTLDTTFGEDGRVTTDINGFDTATSVAVDEMGRIVVAGGNGDFKLARYQGDGSLDTSFGDGDGFVTTDFGSIAELATGVAVDGDKIVAVGQSGSFDDRDFALARYNSDGTLDSTFDDDGKVTTNFGGSDSARAVVIDDNHRIVVAGGSRTAILNSFFALARYNPDGSLDSSFGAEGKVTTFFGDASDDNQDFATSVTIDAQGRIVAAGQTTQFVSNDFAAVRYNTDGSLDPSFGGDGRVISGFFGPDQAQSVAIDAKGRIVMAGWKGFDFGLVRLNSDGSPDTEFGPSSDGRVSTDISSSDIANGVAIDDQGRIVVAGRARLSGTGRDFVLARYISDIPEVESIVVGSDESSLILQLNDVDLAAATAEDVANYTVIAANGDGNDDGEPFNDSDETALTVESVIYDAATDQITIQTAETLVGDFVRLKIDGVTDPVGTALDGVVGEFVRDLNLNRPVVQDVDVGSDLQSFIVQFDDNDLDPTLAENPDNYQVLAANGDANGDGDPFNDGDETTLDIAGVQYDPVKDRATLNMIDVVFEDFFRLELDGDDATTDGTPGIGNVHGVRLDGGDFTADLDLTKLGLVEDLIEKVESLGLDTGTETSLTGKLEGAAKSLGADVEEDAGLVKILEAFKLGVENWFDLGEITVEQRDELIADADLILLGIELTST